MTGEISADRFTRATQSAAPRSTSCDVSMRKSSSPPTAAPSFLNCLSHWFLCWSTRLYLRSKSAFDAERKQSISSSQRLRTSGAPRSSSMSEGCMMTAGFCPKKAVGERTAFPFSFVVVFVLPACMARTHWRPPSSKFPLSTNSSWFHRTSSFRSFALNENPCESR